MEGLKIDGIGQARAFCVLPVVRGRSIEVMFLVDLDTPSLILGTEGTYRLGRPTTAGNGVGMLPGSPEWKGVPRRLHQILGWVSCQPRFNGTGVPALLVYQRVNAGCLRVRYHAMPGREWEGVNLAFALTKAAMQHIVRSEPTVA